VIAVAGLLRALVGAALLAAGAGKLLAPEGVRVAPVLLGSASGPSMLASTVVEDALPALEILAGLAIWTGIGRLARDLIAVILGAIFVAAALLVPEGVRCGCLGVFGGFEGRAAHVAASSGILAAATLLLALEIRAERRSARH
jgi:hypothetical protein